MSVERRMLALLVSGDFLCEDERRAVEGLFEISQRLKRGIMRESVEKKSCYGTRIDLVLDEGQRPPAG